MYHSSQITQHDDISAIFHHTAILSANECICGKKVQNKYIYVASIHSLSTLLGTPEKLQTWTGEDCKDCTVHDGFRFMFLADRRGSWSSANVTLSP